MKKNKGNELIKVAITSVLSIGMFSAAFIGVNSMTFAAASNKVEPITPVAAAVSIPAPDSVPSKEYKKPSLTVYENLNEGYTNYVKSVNALSPEEAAELGAQYIWEMFGGSIDGKTVEMFYSGHPSSLRAYWHGTVANSKEDLKIPETYETYPTEEGATSAATNIVIKSLYDFSIDAVTGERVSIYPHLDIPEPKDLGVGKTYTLSPVQMEAMQYEAPANVDEYAEIAMVFAGKHFNNSKVASVDFARISLSQGDRAATIQAAKAYREAYQAGKDKPFTFTLYEKGRDITFNVTDDTGRVADICIDMDTKQVISLDTTGNDFVPGFNADAPGAVG